MRSSESLYFQLGESSSKQLLDVIERLKNKGWSYHSIGREAGYKSKGAGTLVSKYVKEKYRFPYSLILTLCEISKKEMMSIILNEDVCVKKSYSKAPVPVSKELVIEQLIRDLNDNKNQT